MRKWTSLSQWCCLRFLFLFISGLIFGFLVFLVEVVQHQVNTVGLPRCEGSRTASTNIVAINAVPSRLCHETHCHCRDNPFCFTFVLISSSFFSRSSSFSSCSVGSREPPEENVVIRFDRLCSGTPHNQNSKASS